MKFSVGIDIVDVKDFAKRIERTKSLKNRLFTESELKNGSKKGMEHLASRLAAKEAFKKASGIKNLSWHDVETKNLSSGKPIIVLNKKLKSKFNADISISHTKDTAIAVVILY